MKKVLVTGSNGFIGSHVAEWLKEKEYYVIGLGRNKDSKTPVDEYVCCDLASSKAIEILSQLGGKGLDAVVHLAADMRHEPDTVQVVVANCSGTQKLLEMCEANSIATFVQLSSLPVIGKPIQHPITEEHSVDPPTVYHVTKRTQELLANYAYKKFGVRTVSFRISAPVGIGMNMKTIFPVFVNKALKNENLVLSGAGTRKQTYIHVDDISQAIEKALISNAQGVYNLGSHNLLSNYELAKICVETLKSDSQILFSGTEDSMDDYVWDVSLEKIQQDTGYAPKVSIESAIHELAEYLSK